MTTRHDPPNGSEHTRRTLGRRSLLRGAAAASTLIGAGLLGARAPRSARADTADPHYLFVIGGLGGASIIDSFLPVPESTSSRGAELTTIPDSMVATVPGSELRCVLPFERRVPGYRLGGGFSQADFLRAHKDDLLVVTCESSSVSHASGQQRAMTGDGVDRGRTLLEAVADRWGRGLLVPAANMASAGYAMSGRDATLPPDAEQITIADARYFALGTDGRRGARGAPSAEHMARARRLRETLDATSPFGRTFGGSSTLTRYRRLHAQAEAMESADLISRLLCSTDPALAAHGLTASPDTERLLAAFPALESDDLQAQAALAFLLTRHGVSTAVAISPLPALRAVRDGSERVVESTQLAFDYAHTDHRIAQSVMWSRVLGTADALIRLLKAEHVGGDPARGTMWERSVVYIATEFGRDKERGTAGADVFPTGHHLNNGVVLLSPRVRGNRVLGAVAPETCLTHGFDPATGVPERDRQMSMRDVYAIVCAALDVDYDGRTGHPAAVR